MAKKRKTSQLNPSTAKAISSILSVVAVLIIILSFLGKAGEFGRAINMFLLGPLFGQMKYSVPIVMLLLLWFSLREQEEYRQTYGAGILLFLVASCSLFHLQFSVDEMKMKALEGLGGGIFGMPAWLLGKYMGSIASVTLLIGLLLISILLIFNNSIANFVLAHKKLMDKLGKTGEIINSLTENLVVKDNIDNTFDDGEQIDDYQEFHRDTEPEQRKPKFSTTTDLNEQEVSAQEDIAKKEEPEQAKETEPEIEEKSSEDIDIDQPDYMKGVISKEIPPISLLSSKSQKPSSGDIKKNA
ncbi:MAG: DNA translocase FtsK 4TM domain-containing protein, partial [Candidatus Paceibacteria bacterium]